MITRSPPPRLEAGYDPFIGNPYGRLYSLGITINY